MHPSAQGRGWLYKISGISGSYGYTINNIKLGGQEVFGSFAVVVADRNFVCRLNSLGPKSEKPLPAKLPPVADSNNNLVNRCFTTDADAEPHWSAQIPRTQYSPSQAKSRSLHKPKIGL